MGDSKEREEKNFAERMGYDKKAHDLSRDKAFVEGRLVKNYKTWLGLHVFVIVAAILLILAKFLFF